MKTLFALLPALLLMLLLFSGCDRNPLFFRLAADYYPVTVVGSQWEYSVNGGGSLIVRVLDQVEISERTCYRVLTGGDYGYWIDENGRLEHYEDHRVMFNGFEVPLYQAWVTWLDWPLAVGSARADSISTFAVSQRVTISHDWKRTMQVVDIGDSPDGRWSDCYRIRLTETTVNWIRAGGFEPETTTVSRDIWLAPDVGMVASVTADSTLTLDEYRPGV